MTIAFTQGDARPDWVYQMLSGSVLADGRVATLGYGTNIDTSLVPADVWAGSLLGVLNGIDHRLTPIPTAAVNMELLSASANDTAAGTGARTVTVGYLASGYVPKTVVLTMNGITPVAMPEAVLRINSMAVASAGTNPRGANLGALSMRAAGGAGATYAYMRAGTGIAQSSMYTVPTGRTFDVLAILTSVHQVDTAARAATFSLAVANSAGRTIKGLYFGVTSASNYLHHANGAPVTSVPATFDTWLTCENVSANNTGASGALFGVLR